jgi:hypothetical protein
VAAGLSKLGGGGDLELDGAASGQIKFGTNLDLQANTTDTGPTFAVNTGGLVFSLLRRESFAGVGSIAHLNFEAINDAAGSYKAARVHATQLDRTAGSEDAELRFDTVLAGTLATRLVLKSDGVLAMGNITATGAVAGDIVLPNASFLRGLNAAGTSVISIARITSGDRVSLGNGADLQWMVPLVALGGGAAPTFGTIGGSGPATAAQNAWMRVVDSAGATFWVPAWK